MNYNATRPCDNCPFRTDIEPYLTKARAREIVAALDRGTFSCHKTTGVCGQKPAKETHCTSALIMLEHINRPSQMMRIAERLGMYDRTKLDMEAPVYRSPREWIAVQPSGRGARRRRGGSS